MTMDLRALGGSELRLTTVGLGTWAMGGDDWAFGWGPQDDSESSAAIQRAKRVGVNWVDTAPVYGLGRAEEVVGAAIRDSRSEWVVATKCGRIWDGNRRIGKSLRRDSVRREVDASLRRLGVDVIDLYQIHWPEPDEEIEEGWDSIAELIRQGKVRYGGVSNFNLDQLKRAHAIHPVTSLQPPYSMFRRGVEEDLLPYCREQGIGVVAYSPMQAGLLSGGFTRERAEALPETDWRKRSPYFQEPQLSVNLEAVEQLRSVAREVGGGAGVSMAQLALAWVLRDPVVTAAIVGARKPQQIEETVQASGLVLSEGHRESIEAILRWREQACPALDDKQLRPQPAKPNR